MITFYVLVHPEKTTLATYAGLTTTGTTTGDVLKLRFTNEEREAVIALRDNLITALDYLDVTPMGSASIEFPGPAQTQGA